MKADEKNSKQLACLFCTAYFTAKETLSFLKFEKLCELQQLNGIPLYGENYKSNNTCKRFISSIASDMMIVSTMLVLYQSCLMVQLTKVSEIVQIIFSIFMINMIELYDIILFHNFSPYCYFIYSFLIYKYL